MGSGVNISKIIGYGVLSPPKGVNISKVVGYVVLDTVHLDSIAVTPSTKTLKAGETQQYTATGNYNNSTTQDLTSVCTFTSSDTDVATIDNGVGTPLYDDTFTGDNGDPPDSTKWDVTGSPDIQNNTVEITNNGTEERITSKCVLTGDFDVQVDIDVQGDPASNWQCDLVAYIDATHYMTASAIYHTFSKDFITVHNEGSGESNSTISRSGATGKLRITRVGSTVRPYAADGTGAFVNIGSVFATMGTGPVTIFIRNQNSAFTPTITARYDNFLINSGGEYHYEGGGLATAVDEGETTITATYEGVSGTATLDVITLESIYLTPSNATITEGDTQQYSATAVYSDASEVALAAASCTWASSNTTVATIDSSGFAVSLADGQTTITATYGGISGNTTLTVGAVVVAEVATRLFGIVSFATANTYRDATYLSKRYEFNPNSIGVMQVLATKYPVTVDLVFPDIPYTITTEVTSKKPVRVKGFLMEAVEVRVNPLEGVTAIYLASTMEELPI